jgi:CheY-like chemotaxis protein
VLRASRRASDLVEQILFMSRDQPRRRVPVRLQETVRAATMLIRTGLPPSIAINTRLDEDCPPVLGDASRLHQLVMNLSTNAAQAIGSASGRIDIQLRHEESDPLDDAPLGWVVMEVEDDGTGVSEATSDMGLEPLFTTEARTEAPGPGLSVVHGIVGSHHGRITFDSRPGAGTRVIVHLPATARARLGDDDSPRRLPRRSLRILVVDDEEAVAGVTASILETYGHEVTAVTDPYGALSELRNRPNYFDVVLTDYSMPGLTGLDLVDAVRAVAPHAGIVLSSGYSLADRQLSKGVVHLAKPFTTAQLVATVQRAKALALESPDPGANWP